MHTYNGTHKCFSNKTLSLFLGLPTSQFLIASSMKLEAKTGRWEGLGTARLTKHLLYREYPCCLHTTLASTAVNKSSHTVPQASFMQTSTRPSSSKVPSSSLISPSLHKAVNYYDGTYINIQYSESWS